MTPPPVSLRVASYNIRKGIGLDMRRRPERNLQVLAGLDPDIAALQEADKRLGSRPAALTEAMIRRFSDLVPVAVPSAGLSLGWHGNAVLVRRTMRVLSVRQLDLPGLEPRGALIVEIDHGIRFTIVATHLGLIRTSRRAQLAAIRRALPDHTDQPVILLGDLNEWSATQGLEALGPHFAVHSPGRTYHAAYPMAGLDRIAVAGAATLERAGVDEGRIARIASDHLPVWADLTLGARSVR